MGFRHGWATSCSLASEVTPDHVALRQSLDYRHECRRVQLRFRRDPQAYLAALKQRLLPPCDSPHRLATPGPSELGGTADPSLLSTNQVIDLAGRVRGGLKYILLM